jgi:hypothetical protein
VGVIPAGVQAIAKSMQWLMKISAKV